MDHLFKAILVIRELFNNTIFLLSLAILIFGFAIAMRTLDVSWMTAKVFWFIVGLGIAFLIIMLLKILMSDVPSSTTSGNDAPDQQ